MAGNLINMIHILLALERVFVTARKRSLGQGNILRGCWGGGGMCGCRGVVHGCWGACVAARGGMRGCQGACMVARGWCAWLPGGVHGCWGACVAARGHAWLPGGVCMVAGGHAWLLGGVCGCGGRACN